MKLRFLCRIALVLVALAAAVPVMAQDSRGRVQGTILDPNGAEVPGVSVTLENDGTGIAVTQQTRENGRFLFDQIDPGTYTLTAAVSGFANVVQKNVRVHQRGDVTADLKLGVAGVAETVLVDTGTVAVQFNTSHSELTLEQTFFKELPLATRNPATLIALDPSVNGDFNRNANFDHFAANAYDIGGGTAGQNDVLIDGSPLANSSKLGYNPSIDAVAEFTVRQNAIDAEFGHSAGGVVSMSMKSGTNQIHGSAYYFGGKPDWNAVSNRITRQHSKSSFWNWGGTVGMPLRKNKLFLFSAYEKQEDASFQALNYTLPTALERMGDFSQSRNANGSLRVIYDPLTSRQVGNAIVRDPFPGNKIPANRWDPVAVKMLANLWSPTSAGDDLTGLNNYKYEHYRYYRYYNVSNRVDWQINENWKAFGRVSFFRTNQPANNYVEENGGSDPLKMRRTEGSTRHGLNITGDTVYTFNASTLLSLNASYYKTIDRRNYPEMAVGEEGYANLWPSKWFSPYLEGRPLIYFPNFQIPSGDTFGVRNFWWQQPLGYSMGGVLNKHFTNHSVKVGTNVRFKRGNAARYFFANLTFTAGHTQNSSSGASANTGNPWASFLLGALDPGGSSVQFIPLQESNTEMYAFFVQDDFRVTRKLTLNLGLRYEYEGGYWDSQNRIPQRLDLTDPIPGLEAAIGPKLSSLVGGTTGKTVAQLMGESAGQKSHIFNGAFQFTEEGDNRATSSDKYQFMPRLGLAYRVDDKTAVRVGYGRFYTPSSLTDSGNEPLGMLDLGSFSPTTNALPAQQGVPQAFLRDPFPQGLTPVSGKAAGRYTNLGDTITIDEYQRRPPISDRINLSVQREIWGRTVLDVTYFMNFTTRQMLTVDLNLADPRLSLKYGTALNAQVANPFFNYGTEATFPGALRRQPTVSIATLLKPYPQYGAINQSSTDLGKFRYNSLQIRLQRPYWRGFSFLGTYARNVEKAQLFYDAQDQYDGKLTWQETVNPRNRIVGIVVAELPVGRGRAFGRDMHRGLDLALGGWQITNTYTYRGGSFLRFGAMIAPDTVKKVGQVGPGLDQFWFDKTGFATLPAFTRRTNPLQYDNLTGPSFSNLDTSISKKFTIRESVKLEFRLEAYNALNGINYANPNVNISALNSDFGKTNAQAGGYLGRRLQYMFRLEF